MMRPLIYQDREIGRIYAIADISALDAGTIRYSPRTDPHQYGLDDPACRFRMFFMRKMLKPVACCRLSDAQQEGNMTTFRTLFSTEQSREFRDLFDAL